MSTLKYSFYYLSNKEPTGLNSKIVQEYILKWSMKKCIHIDYYAFNQEFIPDNIDQFALDFFQDYNVTKTIQTNFNEFNNSKVAKVQTEKIPCTVTSMIYFDKLIDPKNNIVCNDTNKGDNHMIRQCMETYKNGMYINNNLQKTLFDDESEEFSLYNVDERAEFVYRLLTHFVIGGKWCQDDIIIEPYLNATKYIYKDLLTVEKVGNSKIQVSSKLYKVNVFDSNNSILFPKENKESITYSFAYLIINLKTRTVALFFHNVGSKLYV